jgi:hypothetical protein
VSQERLKLQGNLITDALKEHDADQAATNLEFLLRTQLLTGDLADKVQEYLKTRPPKKGAVPGG